MNLDEITPLVVTYNEEANIGRTLAGLRWAREVVVVDSGSTDETLDIVAQFPNVCVKQRDFDNFASQCNFGLRHVTTPWTFSIDADYVCPAEFEKELLRLAGDVRGYECWFTYCVHGKPLRGCLYPPRVSLFRTGVGSYIADGHAHKLQIDGPIGRLETKLLHDDRKPLGRWLAAQARYAELEVRKLLATPRRRLGWKDRLRLAILPAPVLTLFYCLLGKGLILDGWPGAYYTLQRVYAELLLSLKLLEARVGSGQELRGESQEPEDGQEAEDGRESRVESREPERATMGRNP